MDADSNLPDPTPLTSGRWPAVVGADIELANFMTGVDPARSNMAAARAVLAEFEGVANQSDRRDSATAYPGADGFDRYEWAGWEGDDSATAGSDGRSFDPQDWGRKWSAVNGSCCYIDLSHVELALPEVSSAKEFVAYWHAMLLTAMRARERANRRLPAGRCVELVANNSDGHGASSWGAHLNFCVPRGAFEQVLHKKVHHLLFLAGFQASSMVFTGQGKVGSENGRRAVPFQISQRADFFETVSGWQTTHRRPIVNLRDEALCGRWGARSADNRSAEGRPADELARLHVIFHDTVLSHVANFLKVGTTQIVLQMIAEGRVDTALLLEDPLAAVLDWSHDVTLRAAAPLLAGGSVTAVQLQLRIAEQARAFVAEGRCRVADAEEILDLWQDTLLKLRDGDWAALAPRLDWVHKLTLIRHALRRRPGLSWDSREVKHLDHQWASLDASQGLYWAMERAGAVQRVVTERQVARAAAEPPNTRAWSRAALLRMAGPGRVKDVNWDSITFTARTPLGAATRTVDLPDPHFTRSQFERATQGCATLDEALDALGAPPPVPVAPPVLATTYGRTWRRY